MAIIIAGQLRTGRGNENYVIAGFAVIGGVRYFK
jgi:hypothetical protein